MKSFLLTASRTKVLQLRLEGKELILESLGFGVSLSDGGVPRRIEGEKT